MFTSDCFLFFRVEFLLILLIKIFIRRHFPLCREALSLVLLCQDLWFVYPRDVYNDLFYNMCLSLTKEYISRVDTHESYLPSMIK